MTHWKFLCLYTHISAAQFYVFFSMFHRMVGVGGDLKGYLVPTLLPWARMAITPSYSHQIVNTLQGTPWKAVWAISPSAHSVDPHQAQHSEKDETLYMPTKSGYPGPHPIWPSTLARMGHPQFLQATCATVSPSKQRISSTPKSFSAGLFSMLVIKGLDRIKPVLCQTLMV